MRVWLVQRDSPLPFIHALVRLFGSEVVESGEAADVDLVVVTQRAWSDALADFVRQVQSRAQEVPLIVVVARAPARARAEALRRGADDLFAIPFSVDELVARVHALQRRATRVRAGPLLVDAVARTASVDGVLVPLTPREYDILLVLARASPRIVSRDELATAFAREPLQSNWLDVHITNMRQKLGAHAWLVVTVRGRGYQLVP